MPMIYAIFREHARVGEFLPARSVSILKRHFPEAVISEEDALQKNADDSRLRFENNPSMMSVVQRLQEYATETGPAYPFEFVTAEGSQVRGVMKRFMIDFFSDEPFSPAMKSRIEAYLNDVFVDDPDIRISYA